MGFVWTINPVANGEILAADIQEIRDNADIMDTTIDCSSHNATNNSGDDTSHNGTINTSVQTGNETAYYTADDVGLKTTHQSTYNVTYKSTYNSADLGADDAAYDLKV